MTINNIDYSNQTRGEWTKCSKSKYQSPINIDTSKIKDNNILNCRTKCNLAINYNNSECKYKYIKNTPTVYLNNREKNKNNYIQYKGFRNTSNINNNYDFNENGLFLLTNFTIHTPSNHTLNGKSYDMEICLYHEDINDQNKGIIISLLYNKVNNQFSKTNRFLQQIISNFNTNLDELINIDVSNDWNPYNLLPEDKSFFTYAGSHILPPCNESWYHIVFEEIGSVKPSIISSLENKFGKTSVNIRNNNKDIEIFYSSNSKLFNEININAEQTLENINTKIEKLNKQKEKLEKENNITSSDNDTNDTNDINDDKSSDFTNTKNDENEKKNKKTNNSKIYIKYVILILIIFSFFALCIKTVILLIKNDIISNYLNSKIVNSK